MDKNKFCLYKGETLCYVEGGTFASDAYLKGGMEAMADVAGTSFCAITADDGMSYNIGKYNVSSATEEQINDLLPKACSAFKTIVELDSLEPKDSKSYSEWCLTKFMGLIPSLLEEYTVEEVVDFYKGKLFIFK